MVDTPMGSLQLSGRHQPCCSLHGGGPLSTPEFLIREWIRPLPCITSSLCRISPSNPFACHTNSTVTLPNHISISVPDSSCRWFLNSSAAPLDSNRYRKLFDISKQPNGTASNTAERAGSMALSTNAMEQPYERERLPPGTVLLVEGVLGFPLL